MKTSIIVVDDHILIGKAIKGIIDNFKDFEVISVCENGRDLVERLENKYKVPDIVLLDVSMPVMDGFQTVLWLKEHFPEVKVVALSMQGDENSVIKMIRNGAVGYLLKNVHPVELEKALLKVVSNGFFYPEWASKMLFSKISSAEENAVKISKREEEFLRYAATDLSYKEIAEIMCCSPRTVESYRNQLCEKLDLKTRVGLAVFAMKNGYVDDF